MHEWPRTLVFTAMSPSSSAASAQVLARLISGAEEQFGFVYQEDGVTRKPMGRASVPVKHPCGNLSRWPVMWRFERLWWYHVAVREGMRQVARLKWDVVLGCHPNLAFALAAAKVAETKGLPFILYLMDLYAESRVNPVEKIWARVTERKLLSEASAVISLTKGLQNHYARKYGISPVLIPHCVTETEIAMAVASKPPLGVGSPILVTYSGGVYEARLDSLLAVKQAIEKLNAEGCPASLLILGKNNPTQLASWGIGGPYVSVRYIEDRLEFMETMRRSDILLSTIAFKSAYPLQDQTCFPTKTFDYFLSGKPMLVVAPGSSDYLLYMKHHRCAITVESPDINFIATAIRQLAADASFRGKVVEAGISRLSEHVRERIQPMFLNTLTEACGRR